MYSTVLQAAVERIRTNINNLGKLKAQGYDVGSLNWKPPREFQSFTYRQSGFELDKKSGPDGRGILRLKKLHGNTHEIPIRLHAVFVEDLDVRRMLEDSGNARHKAEVGWRDFITVLKHHGRKNACHVVEVEPRGTTKECAACSVKTRKPLWVREHSCPSCGFELDRDWNAALNVQSRGLERLGVVHSKDTPVETATTVDTLSVSASRVVETGSPALKKPATAGE